MNKAWGREIFTNLAFSGKNYAFWKKQTAGNVLFSQVVDTENASVVFKVFAFQTT